MPRESTALKQHETSREDFLIRDSKVCKGSDDDTLDEVISLSYIYLNPSCGTVKCDFMLIVAFMKRRFL